MFVLSFEKKKLTPPIVLVHNKRK